MARSWAIAVWALVVVIAAAVVAGIARSDASGGGSWGAGGDLGAAGTLVAAGTLGAVGTLGAAGDLRLNEILASPARDWDGDGAFVARQDEWIEVANVGAAPLDLGPYRLSDADSTIRFAFSGTLPPGEVLWISGRMAEDWQRIVGRTITGLSLNNSGDTARLFRIEGADTVEVDTKIYNSIEGGADRSTARVGGDGIAWVLFDALNKYTGTGQPPSTGCAPTPRSYNECGTPVSATTWGKIKMRFR